MNAKLVCARRLFTTPLSPGLLLAVPLVALIAVVPSARAQAPASLSEFTNKVLTVTVSNASTFGVGAVRFFSNGTTLLSGNFFLTGNGFGPTNATFTQQAPDRGFLKLAASPASSYLETNSFTLIFASTTNGIFTNQIQRPSLPLQTNNGTFKLTTGTNILPVVAFLPPSQILQSNTTTSLSLTAAGFELSYQWRLNGTNLPGASALTSSYQLSNLSPQKTGPYTCVISNAVGAITSAPINISISVPIGFTQHPQSQEIMEGSYLSLSLVATGSIVSYNWYRTVTPLNSQTNSTLIIPIAALTDAGNYYAVLGGYGELATSHVAAVTIRKVGVPATWLGRPFVKVADETTAVPGVASHTFANWANAVFTPVLTFRDGKVHFVAGTTAGVRSLFRWTNGVLSTLVFTNTPNPLGGFFGDLFYPTDEGAGVVNFSHNSAVNGMYAYSASGISNVINFNTPVRTNGAVTNYFGVPGSYGRRGPGVAISSSIFSAPGSFSIVGNGMFFHSSSTLVRTCDDTTDLPGALTGYGSRPTANSVNYDGSTVVFSTIAAQPGGNSGGFYKVTPGGALGGVIGKLADSADLRPDTGQPYSFFSDIDVDGEMIFAIANGTVFGFATNGSVTNVGIGSFVSAAGARQAYLGYSLLLQRWNNGVLEYVLGSGSIVDGKSVSQILAADGQGDDVAVLLKFTDNTYGIYIAFGPGSTAPVITSEPLDFNAVDTATASFFVGAQGQFPLRYQWWKGSSPLTGQTNASLMISNVQALDVAGYSVVVSNNNLSVTSRLAQLTRTIPDVPFILTNLATASGLFGSNATFKVTAVGAAPLSYYWSKDGVPIPNANGPTLTLTNLSAAHRTNYSVIVSNANGSATSFGVPLFVFPVFTIQPVSLTNAVGGTATFTVEVIGIPPITYQWRRSLPAPLIVLTGQTNTTLMLNNLSLTNAGTYNVFVNSGGGASTFSQNAVLTVTSGSLPAAPLLQFPAVLGGQFQFKLPTQAGYNYLVQSKTNLTDLNWTLEQTIPGDGTTKTVTISGSAAMKFIIVIAQ